MSGPSGEKPSRLGWILEILIWRDNKNKSYNTFKNQITIVNDIGVTLLKSKGPYELVKLLLELLLEG